MPPIPDLVRVSKLDTQFFTNPEYTQHIDYFAESTFQRRKVRKEERWKNERELGHGSHGVIWLEQCIHGNNKGKLRAVKKVQKLHCNNYHRELEAIALFSHRKYEQCFVKSFGWYDDDNSIYITMEYLPNGDLNQYLGSPLPENEGRDIVFQVLEGLQYMHQNGFAHRDLKPANILVVCKHPNWWVKIADFGISKRAIEEVTVLRTLTGTPAFTAPEVLGFTQSDSYTDAVDIWALGVTAFLILTGEILFKDQRRLGQYVRGNFTFPYNILLSNKVSKEGCEFVKSLMAPESEDRPRARESLKTPWLACLSESAAPHIQRTIAISEQQKTQSFHSEFEASASWSTQEQPLMYISNNSTNILAKGAESKHSASFSTQDKSSPLRLHSIERELSPRTSIPESISEASIKVRWKERRVLRGHLEPVYTVAFSPDGKLIASASYDQTVRLWDSATGAARAELQGHSDPVYTVAFSPDGKLVASASGDRTVRLWESATGAVHAELQGHSDSVYAVAFSPDGKLIVSASGDRTIRLWDSATGVVRAKLRGHWDPVYAVAFSPDGKLITSASGDETVRLWDSATGAPRTELQGHSLFVNAVTFSPDGKLIASASCDQTVRLWDSATGAVHAELQGHSDSINIVEFSPDGKLVASASGDQTVRLWESATGAVHAELQGHSDSVYAVAFSPDGKLIASASCDQTVRLWDSATGAFYAELQGHSGPVYAVAFSPDGKLIASASVDRMVRLWDSATKVEKDNVAIKFFKKVFK